MPAIQGQSNSSCWACSRDFPVLAQQQAGRATAITVIVVVIVYESNPVLCTKKKARQRASSDICIGSVQLLGVCSRPNRGRVGFCSPHTGYAQAEVGYIQFERLLIDIQSMPVTQIEGPCSCWCACVCVHACV